MIFFIFGWGTRSKSWPLPDGRAVLLTWNFYHIFQYITFSYEPAWYLISGDQKKNWIGMDAAQKMLPAENIQIPFYFQYSGVIVVAGIFVYKLFELLFH